MTAVLPSASTIIRRTGGGVATGLQLATIWGCVTQNADMVPRLWYDTASLEVFHGPGQLLDHVALFVRITQLPALVVPLPIDVEGIIGTQTQAGTGTATASVSVGSDGSLERVDGVLRVERGGTVGVDQIQLSYSLDGGSRRTIFRLGTGTTYAIPRIGQTIELRPGTLITGEEILYWTSTAPTPADADIATARTKLAAQGEQSRAWYLVRELTKEQDVAAYKTAVTTYDTTDKRPLQAYAGLRRAYNRSGLKAQMSHIRSWMTGSPSVTFTQGAGPPNDDVTRATGSFVADGFAEWSTIPDWITIAGASTPGNNGLFQLASAGVTKLDIDGSGIFTTDTDASGVSIWTAPGLEFVDGGVGADLLKRDPGRGSWLDEGFEEDDVIVVTGTASNDGAYPIVSVTADTITVATGSFTAEEISSWDVAVTVSVLYTVDAANMDAAFGTVTNVYQLELSYGHLWNESPTTGARLRYPVAVADMCRSFLRDVAETTWEDGYGSLGGAEGWGMIDANGQPFEYDERIYRAALPGDFTCARTGEDEANVPYIARALTRAGGDDALTQSHYARVTNLARRIVQVKTKKQTGAVFTKRPPDALGRQFLTPQALSTVASAVNSELARQMLGDTRAGIGPRVSSVSWTAATNDDFSVQNPVLHGTLRVGTLATIVTVETAVEVF